MRYPAVTKRTWAARYVRAVGLPLLSRALPNGTALGLDLGPLLTRLQMRQDLREAGVRPGSV